MTQEIVVPPASTKLRVTAILAGLGGLAGVTSGIVLTYLGNVISGYPIPPSFDIYVMNSAVIGVVGAVLGPSVAWSMLRTVPLWRAVLETSVGGLGAAVLSMVFAPSFFVAAVPAGVLAAAFRLRFSYSGADAEPPELASSSGSLVGPGAGEPH